MYVYVATCVVYTHGIITIMSESLFTVSNVTQISVACTLILFLQCGKWHALSVSYVYE